MQDVVPMRRALISVYDKSHLDTLASNLFDMNPQIEVISSGGTYRFLCGLGYPVKEVSEHTGFPESPDGLVKTLHPKIHGGILMDPGVESHRVYMEVNGIDPIDLVVVNLYPFQEKVTSGAGIEEIRENVDIGGLP